MRTLLALMLLCCNLLSVVLPGLWPVPAVSTPTAQSTQEAIAQILLGRINTLRASQALPPYSLNAALMKSAQNQAEWMVLTGQVVHIRPDGSTPARRAQEAGYPNPASCSENIYMGGIATVDDAWNFWITSKVHYAGLVSPWHQEIGIGTAHSDTYGQSFVLVFGATGAPWPTRPPVTVTNAMPVNTPAGPPTATRTPTVYVVQPGDTLFSIATRFGTTVAALAAANGISNPDVIEVGQTLIIP